MKVFGFDPGGGSKFGCASLDTNFRWRLFSARSVDDALAWAVEDSRECEPAIAGIDTLLFWQSTKSGWRGADLYLRERYPNCRNSVLCANGLYGSMAVQGAVLAHRLREQWPRIKLTETHPKVLWHHFNSEHAYPRHWEDGVPPLAQKWIHQLGFDLSTIGNEDEFDAVLSAWAALQAELGKWLQNLTMVRAPDQTAENVALVPNINYFWPD